MELRRRVRMPSQRRTGVLVAGAAAAALTIVGIVWFNQADPVTGSETVVRSQQPVTEQQLELTDSDVAYEAFGPWRNAALVEGREQPASQSSFVWLDRDGSIWESDWKIPTSDPAWHAAVPPGLQNQSQVAVTVNGASVQLVVLTLNNRTFRVFVGQPFVFEGAPENVFVFTGVGGQLAAIPFAHAQSLAQPPADR